MERARTVLAACLIAAFASATWAAEPLAAAGLLFDRYSGFDVEGRIRPVQPLSPGETADAVKCRKAVDEGRQFRPSEPPPALVNASSMFAQVSYCMGTLGHRDLFVLGEVDAAKASAPPDDTARHLRLVAFPGLPGSASNAPVPRTILSPQLVDIVQRCKDDVLAGRMFRPRPEKGSAVPPGLGPSAYLLQVADHINDCLYSRGEDGVSVLAVPQEVQPILR